jgi:hypothetical protein
MLDYSLILDLIPAISITIGVIYYIATLRNQNTSRQIQIIRGVNSRQPTNWKFLEITWSSYDDFLSKYVDNESEHWKNILIWFNNFEELGVYVREGMLNVRLVCLLSGGTYLVSWEKYEPIIFEWRKKHSSPRWFIEAEYIYKNMKEYMTKHKDMFNPIY